MSHNPGAFLTKKGFFFFFLKSLFPRLQKGFEGRTWENPYIKFHLVMLKCCEPKYGDWHLELMIYFAHDTSCITFVICSIENGHPFSTQSKLGIPFRHNLLVHLYSMMNLSHFTV